MTTIEATPDVVTGDRIIGPWRHYEFFMRGELFFAPDGSSAATVYVWLFDPVSRLKWPVCKAKAAYTISDVVFTEPFTRDKDSAAMWSEKTAARLVNQHPWLWCRTVAAQLTGAYMRASCACKEVPC